MSPSNIARSDLEKFLRGEPLNEEMRRLRDGEEFEPEPETSAALPTDFRELDDDDREHLRRLKTDPGWAVLLRLLDRATKNREDAVTAMCLQDPLARAAEISQGWAYVAIWKKLRAELIHSIDREIRVCSIGTTRTRTEKN